MNPYKVLDVSEKAEKKEIKKAYRKKAKKYHPDRNDDPGAAEKFKQIKDAYEMITSKDDRKKGYDNFFNSQKSEDIFSNFFGGKSRNKKKYRSADVTLNIALTLDDIINRRQKTIDVNGKKLSFKVPPNAREGKKIKIKGKGKKKKNGKRGNLYLKVKILPDERFDLKDDNLIYKVKLDYLQMLFGTKITIPNIKDKEDDFTINIPGNEKPNKKIRIKGAGINGGDIVVKTKAKPVDIDDRQLDDLKNKFKEWYNEI